MHILTANINGNPNIGLYCFATDSYCIAGREVPLHTVEGLKKALKVPVLHTNICGTSLVGAFCAGNSSCLILPAIVFDTELKVLEKHSIPYEIIETKLTALGNNLLCNDNGCLANPEFSADQKKRIRQALDVSLKPGTIAGLGIVGSLAAMNRNAGIVHHDITSHELEYLEELMKIKFTTATVNMGNPYISSGIVANSNGFAIGDQSGGPEITNADEGLEFI
jgi:translation initiation factor 6